MTVSVSGNVVDALGRKDVRPWKVWAASYREGTGGGVVTTRTKFVYPVDGVFSAELEPGTTVFEDPDGQQWNVTVPGDDADLWDVLGEAVPQ